MLKKMVLIIVIASMLGGCASKQGGKVSSDNMSNYYYVGETEKENFILKSDEHNRKNNFFHIITLCDEHRKGKFSLFDLYVESLRLDILTYKEPDFETAFEGNERLYEILKERIETKGVEQVQYNTTVDYVERLGGGTQAMGILLSPFIAISATFVEDNRKAMKSFYTGEGKIAEMQMPTSPFIKENFNVDTRHLYIDCAKRLAYLNESINDFDEADKWNSLAEQASPETEQ